MWTMIPKDRFNSYVQSYPVLDPFINEIKLNETDKYIFLPRYFFSSFPSQDLIFHTDGGWNPNTKMERWALLHDNVQFKGALKSDQGDIVAPVIAAINSNTRVGIIKARPGAGKTVMSVYISCVTRKKTLIIVDNNKIAEQWREAIIGFTNLQSTDIGMIQGNVFDADHPFVISMVQTLISKAKTDLHNFYVKIRDEGFDLAFYDECHKSDTGPIQAKASLFLNTKNVVGLSATPFVDNLQKILLENTIGQIISSSTHYELIPRIVFVKYSSGLGVQYSKYMYAIQDFIKQRARYNSILPKSLKYFQVIHALTGRAVGEGHRVIIIVFTVELVKAISDYLTANGIKNRQFYSKQTVIDKENDNVVVATYSFAGAGFDYKQLSCAIIGTPLSGKKSLIQVIGRILRDFDGKIDPVVYDLNDTEFGGLYVKDIPRKIGILRGEFKCEFNELIM